MDSICSKLTQLFLLSRFSGYQNFFFVRQVINSLRCGILLWSSMSRTNYLRVFRLQKEAIRVMKVTRKRASSNTFVKSLQIITLPPIYIYEILIFRFKSLSNQIGTTPIRTISYWAKTPIQTDFRFI